MDKAKPWEPHPRAQEDRRLGPKIPQCWELDPKPHFSNICGYLSISVCREDGDGNKGGYNGYYDKGEGTEGETGKRKEI